MVTDESVIMDSTLLHGLSPLLHQQRRDKQPTNLLWSFSESQFQSLFTECCQAAKIPEPVHPYHMGHGAATHDVVVMDRPLSEVQDRLRHSSLSSTRRYKQASRYMAEIHRLPPPLVEYGQYVEKHLAALMLGKLQCPPPP